MQYLCHSTGGSECCPTLLIADATQRNKLHLSLEVTKQHAWLLEGITTPKQRARQILCQNQQNLTSQSLTINARPLP